MEFPREATKQENEEFEQRFKEDLKWVLFILK
ncbi:hypothetical protein LCGC14_3018660 [marine sediment metagenome]|uniref:Uncharacterized protein n=1 Tax=marine sediment metagenome TaxID=412755 RepID=A0A0F8VXH8_9ZZZZ